MNEIISHTGIFVRNPYGNYVVQYVIELNDMAVNAAIGEQLLGSLLELGRQKYSSNVLEKCLEMNVRRVQDAMVEEMLTAPSYLAFLLDQYGNYVIQKTLAVANKDHLALLLQVR